MIVVDFGEESFAIGGTELLYLPVVQEVLHDRVLPAEAFQSRRVGRIARLCPLPGGELQLSKQDLAELFCGVDVELLTCRVLDGGAVSLTVGRQSVSETSEFFEVDPDPRFLLSGLYGHQRHLDLVVKGSKPLVSQGLEHRCHKPINSGRMMAGHCSRIPGRSI